MEEGGQRANPAMNLAMGLAGAAAGGLAGYLLFGWLVRQGFYAVALPGALLGLGAGLLARQPSRVLPILCGVCGLLLGVFAEWSYLPFVKDGTLSYFLQHLFDLQPVSLIMILLGGIGGYWFARRGPGRKAAAPTPAPPPSQPTT